MTWKFRAHFDGKVIVPDERVDLPLNQPLEIEFTPLAEKEPIPLSSVIEERIRRLTKATGCLSGPVIPDQALRREKYYE